MTELHTVKKDLGALFASQQLAVLATQQHGQPYTSLVAFSNSDDLKSLFFATTRATRKYANLSADPRVALLIDNRSNRTSDFRKAMAVTATGSAGEVDPEGEQSVIAAYLSKHPHLKEFVSSPTCAFIRVRVGSYYLVTRFQDVIEIHLTP